MPGMRESLILATISNDFVGSLPFELSPLWEGALILYSLRAQHQHYHGRATISHHEMIQREEEGLVPTGDMWSMTLPDLQNPVFDRWSDTSLYHRTRRSTYFQRWEPGAFCVSDDRSWLVIGEDKEHSPGMGLVERCQEGILKIVLMMREAYYEESNGKSPFMWLADSENS
jgi:hypothetical protein